MVTDEFTGDLMEARGEWDEDGFHLILETDEDRANIRVFSTDVARALLREVNRLRPWLEEEQRERAAYDAASPEERAAVLGQGEPLTQEAREAVERLLDMPVAAEVDEEALRDRADFDRKRVKGE